MVINLNATNTMNIEELTQSIKTVEKLSGTYDMDSSEFYDALEMVVELAKKTVGLLSDNTESRNPEK